MHLIRHEAVNFFYLLRFYYSRRHWLTVLRHFIKQGELHVAVVSNGQCPRNGRCCHGEDVRVVTFAEKLPPLKNAKPLLFIYNYQPKILKGHFILDDGVSTHHHIHPPLLNGSKNLFSLRRFLFAYQQGCGHPDGIEMRFEDVIMLMCKDLRRRHDCYLGAVTCSHSRSKNRNNGFARSHIALQKPIHHFG